MMKKSLSIFAFLITASYAMDLEEGSFRLSPQKSVTVVKNIDLYWENWLDAKTKQQELKMVSYVHSISETDPEAAMWFLLTGGKYGFENRMATDTEALLMRESFDHVAKGLSQQTRDNPVRFYWDTYGTGDTLNIAHYLYLQDLVWKMRQKALADQIEDSKKDYQKLSSKIQELSTPLHDLHQQVTECRQNVLIHDDKVDEVKKDISFIEKQLKGSHRMMSIFMSLIPAHDPD